MEFPSPEGFSAVPRDDFSAMIPADQCKELFKLRTKLRKSPKAILHNVALDEQNANGRVQALSTDLEHVNRVEIRPLEGKFPDLSAVKPSSPINEHNSVSVQLDIWNLKRLLDGMAAQLDPKSDEDGKIVITLRLEPGEELTGIAAKMSEVLTDGGGPKNFKPLAARARHNMVTVTTIARDGTAIFGAIMPRDASYDKDSLLPKCDLD